MNSRAPVAKSKLILVAGVVLVVLGVTAFLFRDRYDLVVSYFNRALDTARTWGPLPFFSLMALLPLVGAPLMAFSLTAGPIFGPKYGLPTVAAFTVLAIAVNLAISYWLARYALRPTFERLLSRLGYRLPQVAAEDHFGLTVVVRVTPGPPFFIQNYLLGLAGVRFSIFMAVSTVVTSAYAVAAVFFGESLFQGRGKMAIVALSLLVVITVVVQWLRRKYTKSAKKTLATPAA